MAHLYNKFREDKVAKRRAPFIARGHASGGRVHDDEASDRKMIKGMVKGDALKVGGAKAKFRADRARGGRVAKKGAKTVVNVITGGAPPIPPGGGAPGLGALPPPPAGAPGPLPPRPPMGGPPGIPPPPMRKSGGRVKGYAAGGSPWGYGARGVAEAPTALPGASGLPTSPPMGPGPGMSSGLPIGYPGADPGMGVAAPPMGMVPPMGISAPADMSGIAAASGMPAPPMGISAPPDAAGPTISQSNIGPGTLTSAGAPASGLPTSPGMGLLSRAKGGRVNGKGTPVSHSPNKMDAKFVGTRGKPVTYNKGGKVHGGNIPEGTGTAPVSKKSGRRLVQFWAGGGVK